MHFIDLSHEITQDMTVYPGFPEPRIGVYLSHEDSRSHYDGKAEFLINEVGNYWRSPPYLSDETVEKLIKGGAALVGVDWGNVDNTGNPERPAHTYLLEKEVLIVENMRNLTELEGNFRFYAIPLRIDTASFPVRAFAQLENP